MKNFLGVTSLVATSQPTKYNVKTDLFEIFHILHFSIIPEIIPINNSYQVNHPNHYQRW